jgi:FixJ family two-component response regulator
LTDLVMPDVEGIELICELQRLHPGIKIIAMSGGGRNHPETLLQPARLLGAVGTLGKPFSNQQLLDAVQAALGRTPNQPAQ